MWHIATVMCKHCFFVTQCNHCWTKCFLASFFHLAHCHDKQICKQFFKEPCFQKLKALFPKIKQQFFFPWIQPRQEAVLEKPRPQGVWCFSQPAALGCEMHQTPLGLGFSNTAAWLNLNFFFCDPQPHFSHRVNSQGRTYGDHPYHPGHLSPPGLVSLSVPSPPVLSSCILHQVCTLPCPPVLYI